MSVSSLMLIALPLAAASIQQTKPEDVGLSSARTPRLIQLGMKLLF